MGWWAAIPAIISAASQVGGMVKGSKGSKASKQEKAILKMQKLLADEQLQMARNQNQLYEQSYMPIERQLAGQASVGTPAEYLENRAGIDVRRTFDNSLGSYRRGMGRMGINPADPRYANALANMSLLRASAEAGARTGARDKAREETWLRRLQAANIGRGIGNSVQSATNSASDQYAGLYKQNIAAQGRERDAISNLSDWAAGGGPEKLGKDIGTIWNGTEDKSWGGIGGLFNGGGSTQQ